VRSPQSTHRTEIGAEYVGIVQSLLSTCRVHGIDPYTYLYASGDPLSDQEGFVPAGSPGSP